MWPDVAIKSCPNFGKHCPRSIDLSSANKLMFFKIPPKRSTCVLANFVRKKLLPRTFKIRPIWPLNSSSNEIVIAYFLKWAIYYLFFVVFGLFEYHYNYTANKCEKWSIWDSNLRPLEQEFPPITTRPGLSYCLFFELSQLDHYTLQTNENFQGKFTGHSLEIIFK